MQVALFGLTTAPGTMKQLPLYKEGPFLKIMGDYEIKTPWLDHIELSS